jgi:beta-glucosidase
MTLKRTLLTSALIVFSLLVFAQEVPKLGKNSVNEVVKAMTLEEKAALVVGTGFYMPGVNMPGLAAIEPGEGHKRVPGASGAVYAIPRLGIPAVVVTDGPAGVHIFNAGKGRQYFATAWPSGTLLASTWDTTLVKNVGAAFGAEAKEYGVDVVLGPGMNIHRNPLGARNFEYYSEDPVLTGYIAAAMIDGIQSKGVGTSAKHYAANNQETNRGTVNTILSERALREVYLRGWEIAVKKSSPWTIMSSYNKINGIYTSESYDLLTNVLRKDWGYKGMIMTDWFGGRDAIAQMKAGNNLLMPGVPQQTKAIIEAVKGGQLPESVLDANVAGILELVLKTPTFAKYKYADQYNLAGNAVIARDAAAQGMVLLKNNGQALPIKRGTRVALFGNNSLELIAGGTGSGETNKMYTVPLADGLFKSGLEINAEVYAQYSDYLVAESKKHPKKSFFEEFMNPTLPMAEFVPDAGLISSAAAGSDIAVIAIGRQAGEGVDRKVQNDYYFTEKEKQLLKSVSDMFHGKNKKVVVVLNVGGVVDVTEWRDNADAILLAWQPGMEGGNAIADVITGKVNPSGKLASTFPASYNDVPSAKSFPGKEFKDKPVQGMMGMPAFEAEVTYDEGIYVGYRYYKTFGVKPAYEFGYGLSYTDFTYSDLSLSAQAFNNNITVSVTVKNSGAVAGREVVQLYLTAPTGKLDKPAVELKGFVKTGLMQPGEIQTLSFTLNTKDLASYNTAINSWVADAGTYTVKVGTSETAKLSGTFKLGKSVVVEKTTKALVPAAPITELKPKAKI